MSKLLNNNFIVQTFIRLVFLFLMTNSLGCKLFQPTAYFIISNGSEDKTTIDIQIKISGQLVFDDSIKYTYVRPDLQYTPSITLAKGKYTIIVSADSGKAILTQPIMLDSDRWIFISYSFKSPADSTEAEKIKRNYGYDSAYMSKKLRGTPSQVGISIMDKEPNHL